MDILPKHVSDDIRTIFNKYFNLYCEYDSILNTTKSIISDIEYFNAHMSRTKKTDLFTFNATLTINNSIHSRFIKLIGENISQDLKNLDNCMVYVSIYKIMDNIFRKWFDNIELCANQYVEFKPVLTYYLTQNPDDFISSFIGCSHGQIDFVNKLHELKK